ncbi:MAG: hypothetical protein FJZ11_04430 [Candidatus Omnitrophica bacterium]|nr:hypothetical protein [Candidatus Omnitrophota bacterium]
MRLKRFFIFLFMITVISLLYVQMQVEIVKLAYEGRTRESRLKDLLDARSLLVYNINKLESANNLGQKLLCSEKNLQFADRTQIASLKLPARADIKLASSKKRSVNFLANLFSLKSQAEATEKIK